MKLNWGTGIALFYSCFVAIMVGMVVYSRTFDHSLVVDNYYEEDLAFQSRLEAQENELSLGQRLRIMKKDTDKTITFEFPAGQLVEDGKILFYRPDDKTKDFEVAIEGLSGQAGAVDVPYGGIAGGLWKIKVSWASHGRRYYREDILVL